MRDTVMSASDLRFTSEQEPHVENYHPLCGLAVASLVLGILSPLAVINLYWVAAPLLSVVLALAALRRIRSSGGELSGRRLAVAALAIACFFATWAMSRDVGRRWILARDAREFCDAWLRQMVEGNVLEAYQWALDPGDRVAADVPLEAYYQRNEEAANNLEVYYGVLPFKADDKTSALREFRYLGTENVMTAETGEDLIVLRYELIHDVDGEPKSDVVLITTRRLHLVGSKFVHWKMGDLRLERLAIPGAT
jgi:hypothetical protein